MSKKSPPLYLHTEWSEAKFRQTLKSALRTASKHWPPKNEVLKNASRKIQDGAYKNGNPKFKTQHQCDECSQWFDKIRNKKGNLVPAVEVDHIIPIGGFSDNIYNWAEDLGEMYKRTFVPIKGLRVLCSECHKKKTDEERESGVWKKN